MEISTVSRTVLVSVCCCVLASCGGGSSGQSSADDEQSIKHAPVLVVSDIIPVLEEREVLITLSAEDQDGDELRYSILGGSDHSAVTVAPNGAISFASIPDFEAPTDTDSDNSYELSVQVSDGLAMSSAELTIVIVDVLEGRVTNDPIAGAEVFLDLNQNYRLDTHEPRGLSDDAGYFDLDRTIDGPAPDAKLIATGGVEVGSNFAQPNLALFSAMPEASGNFIALSPITTLLASIEQDQDRAQFLQAMGINQSVTAVFTEDSWAQAMAGNNSAQASLRIDQQLTMLLLVIECLIELQVEPDGIALSQALAESLLDASQDNNQSLGNSANVRAILRAAVAAIDINSLPDQSVLAAISNGVAAVNELLASNQVNPTSTLAKAIKASARERLPSLIKSLLTGEISVSEFTQQTQINTLFADIDPGAGYLDTDGDGLIDLLDSDSDNDGVEDRLDAFPRRSDETTDTDNDGVGNNADTDDAFPLDATETLDTDGDGDGVIDSEDAHPLDPNSSAATIWDETSWSQTQWGPAPDTDASIWNTTTWGDKPWL